MQPSSISKPALFMARVVAFLNRFAPVIQHDLKGRVVVLDNMRFGTMRAENCVFVYFGGRVDLGDIGMINPRFVFVGKAGRALEMLHILEGIGGTDIIGNFFHRTIYADRMRSSAAARNTNQQ